MEEAVETWETDLDTCIQLDITNTAAKGWDILNALQFHLTNLQKNTGDLFPVITKKLKIYMPFQMQCS